MTLRETVARAIARQYYAKHGAFPITGAAKYIEGSWHLWLPEADAAIAATFAWLREPSEAAIDAGWKEMIGPHGSTPKLTYLAMLAAAEKEAAT